jgi:hypothetical protein
MPVAAEMLDGGPPHQLVPAVVVGRIHVPNRKDPHRREDRVPAYVEAPVALSVVVASHGRDLRLRWLLNALEEQTLPRGGWEVVVVHDYDSATAERVIDHHALTEAGLLRHIAIAPGSGSPARQRNMGWRAARGELIAFTDDDCRPEPDWLERLVAVARREPGAVVQGTTRPDPLEYHVGAAAHVRSLLVDPVGPYAQCSNILYPRSLLEGLDGFDERAIAGEDVDLSLRARAAGRAIVGAADAVVNHAVEAHTLPGIMRQNVKWQYLAYVVKRHPEFRREMALGIFWDEEHLWSAAALLGLVGARLHPVALALVGPYVIRGARRRGPGRRALALALSQLPGQAVRQMAEVVVLAGASIRHRTVVL